MRLPIRWKLTIYIVLPLMVIYVGGIATVLKLMMDRGYAGIEEMSLIRAKHYTSELDWNFRALAQVARSAASFLTVERDISEEEVYKLLTANVKQNP